MGVIKTLKLMLPEQPGFVRRIPGRVQIRNLLQTQWEIDRQLPYFSLVCEYIDGHRARPYDTVTIVPEEFTELRFIQEGQRVPPGMVYGGTIMMKDYRQIENISYVHICQTAWEV